MDKFMLNLVIQTMVRGVTWYDCDRCPCFNRTCDGYWTTPPEDDEYNCAERIIELIQDDVREG